jgi:hypothetical protein
VGRFHRRAARSASATRKADIHRRLQSGRVAGRDCLRRPHGEAVECSANHCATTTLCSSRRSARTGAGRHHLLGCDSAAVGCRQRGAARPSFAPRQGRAVGRLQSGWIEGCDGLLGWHCSAMGCRQRRAARAAAAPRRGGGGSGFRWGRGAGGHGLRRSHGQGVGCSQRQPGRRARGHGVRRPHGPDMGRGKRNPARASAKPRHGGAVGGLQRGWHTDRHRLG